MPRPPRSLARPATDKAADRRANEAADSQPDSSQFDVPEYQIPDRPGISTRKRFWQRLWPWSRTQRQQRAKRRPSLRRVVWTSLAVLTVLVLGVGGFLSWRAYANLHKVFRGTSTAAVLDRTTVPDDLKTEGDGRVNILLMGIGGPSHTGSDLTDTLVILSVDPVNNSATMLSVPRDLWVKMPITYFGKEQKINAAYESGKYNITRSIDSSNENAAAIEAGFDNIDNVMKTVFNVKIHYHVLVNFDAFKQAVDTVGGIDVNVPIALVDPTMAWDNWNNPVIAAVGQQHMDGHKALLYARSRETTSDFARNQRQRQILLALKDKALDLGTLSNPAKIDGLMNAFGDNVYADLSTSEANKLYGIMKNISDDKVLSIGLTDEPHKLVTTDRVNNASVVRPVAGFFEYGPIQDYVRSQLLDGYIIKENAPITVAAATQAAADATAALLKGYGYNVTATAVTEGPVTETTLVNFSGTNGAPYTMHYLQERFKVQAVTQLPTESGLQRGSAKFVILVPNEAVTK